MQITLRGENYVFTELVSPECMKTEHCWEAKSVDEGSSSGACHHQTSINACPGDKASVGAGCGRTELLRNGYRWLQEIHQEQKSIQAVSQWNQSVKWNQSAFPLKSAKPFTGTSAVLPCLVCRVSLDVCFLLSAKHAVSVGKCCWSSMLPQSFCRWAEMLHSDKERAPDARIPILMTKGGENLVEWK